MIHKFTKQSSHSSSDRGFILPIAIGLGLITSLVGVVMLVRSHNDETNVQMREALVRSEALAELAVTRYRNLINENREIATFASCRNGHVAGTCDAKSWNNAAELVDEVDPVKKEEAVELITSLASQEWQDAPEGGQFRLLNYTYDSVKKIGTLIVEGRVNLAADGTESAGTTARRLRVSFPVIGGNFPGGQLWVSCNPESNVQPGVGTVIESDIRDSTPLVPDATCSAVSDPITVDEFKVSQPLIPPPDDFKFHSTPTEPLPPLPEEGQIANIPTTGVCTSTRTTPITVSTTLPIPNDPNCVEGAGTYYTYNLTNQPFSIKFAGANRTLTIDAPGETVTLYVNGIQLSGTGSRIAVTEGTTLKIYAHDSVAFTASSSGVGGVINNTGTPDKFQIYQYSSERVTVNGGNLSAAFIFAPFAQVWLSNNSRLAGAVWARSYLGDAGTRFIARSDINCANLTSGICSGGNTIGSISSWEVIAK
jgi:hypothetical protein